MKDGVKEIVGKQVTAVVVAESVRSPTTQMFLTFSDGTYFEIWGNTFTGAGGVDVGGVPEVLKQITVSGGSITATFDHSDSLDSNSPTRSRKRHTHLARWLCVVPGAILAALLVTFPLHWLALGVQHFGSWPLTALAPEQMERFLYAFGVPYAAVIASAFIAPAYRARTGLITAVGVVLLLVLGAMVLLNQSSLIAIGPTWSRFVLPILWAAGIGAGIYITRRADEW